MIWPVVSFTVALRLPLTATVETMPSLAALPPNMFNIRPSMPSNLIWVFSRVLTSARAGPASASSGSAMAHEISRRFMCPPEGVGIAAHNCKLAATGRCETAADHSSGKLEQLLTDRGRRASSSMVGDRRICPLHDPHAVSRGAGGR